jgi:ribosomal-protein-alanine N-acetyltransferase
MITFQLNPFPELRTERLLLRRIVPADAPALLDIRSREEVMQYISRPRSQNLEDVLQHIALLDEGIAKNESISWAISLQSEPERLIGTVGYYRTKFEHHRSEIGYLLHPDFWQQGIMTEAMDAAVAFGFTTLNLHSMEGCIDPNNAPSRAVLLRQQFVKEALYKENYYYEGQWLDTEVLSLLKSQWMLRISSNP